MNFFMQNFLQLSLNLKICSRATLATSVLIHLHQQQRAKLLSFKNHFFPEIQRLCCSYKSIIPEFWHQLLLYELLNCMSLISLVSFMLSLLLFLNNQSCLGNQLSLLANLDLLFLSLEVCSIKNLLIADYLQDLLANLQF